MGMFDSYHLPIGGHCVEVQTKAYDSTMTSWYLGQRVEQSEVNLNGLHLLRETHYSHDRGHYSDKLPNVFIVHWNGRFVDGLISPADEPEDIYEQAIHTLWANPLRRNVLLQILLDYNESINSRAIELTHKATSLQYHYQQFEEEQKNPSPNAAFKKLLSFGSPDFDQTTLPEELSNWAKTASNLRNGVLPDLISYAKDHPTKLRWSSQWTSPQEALRAYCDEFDFTSIAKLFALYPKLSSETQVLDTLMRSMAGSLLLAPTLSSLMIMTSYAPKELFGLPARGNDALRWLLLQKGDVNHVKSIATLLAQNSTPTERQALIEDNLHHLTHPDYGTMLLELTEKISPQLLTDIGFIRRYVQHAVISQNDTLLIEAKARGNVHFESLIEPLDPLVAPHVSVADISTSWDLLCKRQQQTFTAPRILIELLIAFAAESKNPAEAMSLLPTNQEMAKAKSQWEAKQIERQIQHEKPSEKEHSPSVKRRI